jgi:hypothetical protein
MWIILLLLIAFLGYLSIAYWAKDFSKIEKITLSFCLGMGEASFIIFLLGLIKVPFTIENIFLYLAAIDISLLLLIIKTKKENIKIIFNDISFPKINIVELLLITFIVFLFELNTNDILANFGLGFFITLRFPRKGNRRLPFFG